jgi:hypothetical protein
MVPCRTNSVDLCYVFHKFHFSEIFSVYTGNSEPYLTHFHKYIHRHRVQTRSGAHSASHPMARYSVKKKHGDYFTFYLSTHTVNLSLCLTKYHDMKTYKRVEVQLHAFLISALDGGKWSATRSDRFTAGERTPGTHWIGGWVGPRAGLEAVEKRKNLSPCRESNPGRPANNLVTELHRLLHIYDMWCIPLTRLAARTPYWKVFLYVCLSPRFSIIEPFVAT